MACRAPGISPTMGEDDNVSHQFPEFRGSPLSEDSNLLGLAQNSHMGYTIYHQNLNKNNQCDTLVYMYNQNCVTRICKP